MSTTEVCQSGFGFRAIFLDDDGREIDRTTIDILVDQTEDREADRDTAYSLADDKAEELLEEYAAEDFEISLVDAY